MKIKYSKTIIVLLVLLPLVSLVFCIGIGRYGISMADSIKILSASVTGRQGVVDQQAYSVIWSMRLPRLMLDLLCGMGLSVAGASLQALFSNPLTSSDTLGVSAGAAFGAALALLFSANLLIVQISSLSFGIFAVAVAIYVGKSKSNSSIVMMILAGVLVSYMFQAFVSLVKYVADTDSKLPAITFWLMGSMSGVSYKTLSIGTPFILIGSLSLYAMRWKLNVLSLGDDEAKSLGINLKRTKLFIIFFSSMITAACVSMCGMVGWVGLLIPHLSRMLFGNNNLYVIPASISLGATFLILIDTIARSATAAEIPISILTAIIGAPIFIMLLKRTGGAWR
ncbi:MAG: iron ABC transporter permease [Peptostreptococcaceae bacterium]|nr:iron ABC transporter permease [Peptostreptococcaceae bacterium]